MLCEMESLTFDSTKHNRMQTITRSKDHEVISTTTVSGITEEA
jgi:hypothetical protein